MKRDAKQQQEEPIALLAAQPDLTTSDHTSVGAHFQPQNNPLTVIYLHRRLGLYQVEAIGMLDR
jgi:hypothetical protein